MKKRRLRQFRKNRIKSLPFNRLLPNLVTLMALCMGLSSIRFALMEKYELAVISIVLAAILDGMDGRFARFLNATSNFGAELDSLSDLVSFGVAPALVLYIFSLSQWKGFGWAICLLYVICMTLRLARFNTDLLQTEDERTQEMKYYFTGIPAPAGAILVLTPLMFKFAFNLDFMSYPLGLGVFLIGIGSLLVSRIPTFSLKGKRVDKKFVLPLMLFAGVLITALINAFWFALIFMNLLYLMAIPLSLMSHRKLCRQPKPDLSETPEDNVQNED